MAELPIWFSRTSRLCFGRQWAYLFVCLHSGRPQICIPIPCALVRLININTHGNLRERFQNVWLYFPATPHHLRRHPLWKQVWSGGFTEGMINSAWVDLSPGWSLIVCTFSNDVTKKTKKKQCPAVGGEEARHAAVSFHVRGATLTNAAFMHRGGGGFDCCLL